MRALWALLLLLLIPGMSQARVVWQETDFVLETKGWNNAEDPITGQPVYPEWTGVNCGLSIPRNGYFAILDKGALELLIGDKWVSDIGIMIIDGCVERGAVPQGGDTLSGACNVTESFECDEEGDRVLMVVRIPKIMYPTDRPTAARWVKSKVSYNVQTYR